MHQVSMVFEKGKKYALSGPSGCGKSTLLKLMIGYLKDYQGSITFDGKDQKEFAEDSLTRQMAYIDQNTYLFQVLSEKILRFFRIHTAVKKSGKLYATALWKNLWSPGC